MGAKIDFKETQEYWAKGELNKLVVINSNGSAALLGGSEETGFKYEGNPEVEDAYELKEDDEQELDEEEMQQGVSDAVGEAYDYFQQELSKAGYKMLDGEDTTERIQELMSLNNLLKVSSVQNSKFKSNSFMKSLAQVSGLKNYKELQKNSVTSFRNVSKDILTTMLKLPSNLTKENLKMLSAEDVNRAKFYFNLKEKPFYLLKTLRKVARASIHDETLEKIGLSKFTDKERYGMLASLLLLNKKDSKKLFRKETKKWKK